MSTANRVIKNTLYLYMKMCITMFLSLYTTRLVLHSLGSSDFGIFNVIAGAVAMLGFLNSTLAYATQRFMTYAKGENDYEKQCKVFNISIVLHVSIAIVTALIQLSLMYPLFNGILNISAGREVAAKVIYISLICSTMISIVNATYDAVLNAYENMRLYSIVGIIDALLRVAVAVVCSHTTHDRLMFYGILMSVIPVFTFILTSVYCHKQYTECIIAPRRYWDFSLIKDLASFSGWNFLTAISSLFSVQGTGLILNHFYGSKLNTAQGIAVQLNGYLSAFASNMLKAINPAIVKSAGAKELSSMNLITLLSCKYSTFLIILFAIPCVLEMNFLLKVWLENIPDWTKLFCILQIFQAIILQLASPLATSVYAQGHIKDFSILKSIMNILPVFLTFLAFKIGAAPYWMYILMILFYAFGGNLIIIIYAIRNCKLSIMEYLKDVNIPISLMIITMLLFGILPSFFMISGIIRFSVTIILSLVGFLVGFICFGMKSYEKQYLRSVLAKVLRKYNEE